MSKRNLPPLVLLAVLVACAGVAWVIGRPVWAAALGAGLCLAYWALEVLTWRRGESSDSFGGALGVALAGMVLRLAVVLVALVLVAVLAREAFTTAVFAFILSFSLYLGLRLVVYASLQGPVGHSEAPR